MLDLPDSHAARGLKLPAPTGVVSAVLINLPYTLWFLRRSAREGVLARR